MHGMDRSLFTAKFKKDYVAASAVAIFCLIVVAEITLAVGIPTYLLRSNIWALQIRRQQLLDSFDALRGSCNDAKIRNTAADNENRIVLWSLNLMANYLRVHRQSISAGEIAGLRKDIKDLSVITAKAKHEECANREVSVDTRMFLSEMTRRIANRSDDGNIHEQRETR